MLSPFLILTQNESGKRGLQGFWHGVPGAPEGNLFWIQKAVPSCLINPADKMGIQVYLAFGMGSFIDLDTGGNTVVLSGISL